MHHIDVVVGGRYVGAGSGDVDVRRTAAATPPPPVAPPPPPPVHRRPTPPPVTPPPPTGSALRVLSPNLASVAGRLKVSKTGRVAVRLRCRTTGTTGALASTCRGTVRLTARIGGKRRTIGAADYGFPRTAAKTVSVKLTAAARRAIRRATAATLTVSTTNPGRPSRTATKAVTVVPRTT